MVAQRGKRASLEPPETRPRRKAAQQSEEPDTPSGNGHIEDLLDQQTQAIQSPKEAFVSTLMVAGLKKADAERLAQFMNTACDLMNPT